MSGGEDEAKVNNMLSIGRSYDVSVEKRATEVSSAAVSACLSVSLERTPSLSGGSFRSSIVWSNLQHVEAVNMLVALENP